MRYLVSLICCLSCSCLFSLGQGVPQAVNFSINIHDVNDAPIVNTAVNVRVTLFNETDVDSPEYCAIYQTITNSRGDAVFRLDRDMLAYGCNGASSIDFDEIQWEEGTYWMQIEYQSDMAEDFFDWGYIELSSGFYSLVTNYAFVAEKIDGFGLDVSAASDGDVLVYDAVTGKWKPRRFEFEGENTEQGNVFTDVREYVDLGLPSGNKWATCNIGAGVPEERGNYYAWGETKTKEWYDWNTYKFAAEPNSTSFTKYCTDSEYGYSGFVDNIIRLEPIDDAATVNWGANWRTPTIADYCELMSCCTITVDTVNEMEGIRFTCANGNSIFLPKPGRYWRGRLDWPSYGEYLTSNLYHSWPLLFTSFEWFDDGDCQFGNGALRDDGYAVRAIYDTTHGAVVVHNGVLGESFIDSRDGNEYTTITIGTQTWMRENLRYEGNIAMSSYLSNLRAYRYYPGGSEDNVQRYGYLYNWKAAMNGESGSNSAPSGVRGICPEGWHLPSNVEWATLQHALGGINVGSRLASASDVWQGEVTQVPEFGTSGFEALPAGCYSGSDSYGALGYSAEFISTTERDEENVGIWTIKNNDYYFINNNFRKKYGYSIRCVRDN